VRYWHVGGGYIIEACHSVVYAVDYSIQKYLNDKAKMISQLAEELDEKEHITKHLRMHS
jgi:hypothetical protein